jgi:hypothetical protein
MDGQSFDRLARLMSAAGSRREALSSVLGVVLFGATPPALTHGKERGKTGTRRRSRGRNSDRRREKTNGRDRRKRNRVRTQAAAGGCCSRGNCTPGAGKNLDKCCYEEQSLAGRNFKGANLGGANFTGAILTNANFSNANLDKTCFVDADLTGARVSGASTGAAIFCRTTMPDGSRNDSGCGRGTNCCPTCDGPCPSGQHCCGNGECRECCSGAQCPSRVCCRGSCCAEGQTCEGDTCSGCMPQCDGRECGPDDCDGECGPGCSGTTPICSDAGRCVECVAASDCPDPDPGQCRTRACVNNTCQPQIADDGSNPRNACPGSQVCCSGACAGCCTASDCTPPARGTATCSQGLCQRFCDNNLHRICGADAGVCQECCGNDNQCAVLNGTCVDGFCECSGANESRCGMECINLSIEPNHCGTCDRVCASGRCLNGQCADPEPCGFLCNPLHDPDCEPTPCSGDKECSRLTNGICTCPGGMVDCDGDGFCESCGRCGVTACPDDPETGAPGFCCPGGYCSCGGECCAGPECWVTTQGDGEGTPIVRREHCDSTSGCVDCWGRCCTACINGECASSGPIGGGAIRRR